MPRYTIDINPFMSSVQAENGHLVEWWELQALMNALQGHLFAAIKPLIRWVFYPTEDEIKRDMACCYFIHFDFDPNTVKIGTTSNFKGRYSGLKAQYGENSILALATVSSAELAYLLERALHIKCQPFCSAGEWFHRDETIEFLEGFGLKTRYLPAQIERLSQTPLSPATRVFAGEVERLNKKINRIEQEVRETIDKQSKNENSWLENRYREQIQELSKQLSLTEKELTVIQTQAADENVLGLAGRPSP